MLNNFMKLYLDTDQRKLLKLRSAQLIQSDLDERASDSRLKLKFNNGKLLDLYVDNLFKKEITEVDTKLFEQ